MAKNYVTMDGNEAAAYVSYNFTEVAGIYPITPASPMAELTDKWSIEGKLNYFGIPVKVGKLCFYFSAIILRNPSIFILTIIRFTFRSKVQH